MITSHSRATAVHVFHFRFRGQPSRIFITVISASNCLHDSSRRHVQGRLLSRSYDHPILWSMGGGGGRPVRPCLDPPLLVTTEAKTPNVCFTQFRPLEPRFNWF